MIIEIAGPIALLLIVALIILIVVLCCRKKSATCCTTRGMSTDTAPALTNEMAVSPSIPLHDIIDQSNRYSLNMHDDHQYEVVLDRNPSYRTIPEKKKKKEFDGDYHYVVSAEEMIKTDTNPSYAPISAGNNVLVDNPSYQPL